MPHYECSSLVIYATTLAPRQEGADEVQFFSDNLPSHEEYLHSHKWRAVNKFHCGEPQSDRTISRREGSDQVRWQSFSTPSCINCSHWSIALDVLNKKTLQFSIFMVALLVAEFRSIEQHNLALCWQPFELKNGAGHHFKINMSRKIKRYFMMDKKLGHHVLSQILVAVEKSHCGCSVTLQRRQEYQLGSLKGTFWSVLVRALYC